MAITKSKYDNFIKKIVKDPDYFSKLDLSILDKPVNLLMGPNGCGKSQTLKALEEKLKKENILFIKYSTSNDAQVGTYVNDWNRDSDTYEQGILSAFRSEGERMNQLFNVWFEKQALPALLSKETKDKPIRILIDEADSGLSIDRIMNSLRGIVTVIVPTELKKKRDIQFFLTLNSYEMFEALQSEYTKNIWVPTQEVWSPKSYEDFSKPYKYYFEKVFKNA